MVSPDDVVGIGSEYFVVYFRVYIYICSADYVRLPVLLYLLQCLVYHMLSKMIDLYYSSGTLSYASAGPV